eukprot:gene930-237_t
MSFNWEIFGEEVIRFLGFTATKALDYAKRCSDHHKIMQLMYIAIADELLVPFVRNGMKLDLEISVNRYWAGYQESTINPNYTRVNNHGHYQLEINKNVEAWVTSGVPTDDNWFTIFRNLDELCKPGKSTSGANSAFTCDMANDFLFDTFVGVYDSGAWPSFSDLFAGIFSSSSAIGSMCLTIIRDNLLEKIGCNRSDALNRKVPGIKTSEVAKICSTFRKVSYFNTPMEAAMQQSTMGAELNPALRNFTTLAVDIKGKYMEGFVSCPEVACSKATACIAITKKELEKQKKAEE